MSTSGGKRLPILGAEAGAPLERLLEGDSAAVIAQLQAHLAESPGDEVAWLQLGTAYLHIHHWYEAANALREAVECDGSVVEARRMYAAALTRLRRLDEAAFQLVQAKRLAPDDPLVARELGIAFYDKRLHDKALRELERARTLAPDDPHTYYAIGLCHEARGAMADAIAAYRQAVALHPGFVDARRTLADALAAMGEMSGAVQELEQALRHDRTNTQIATNLEVLKKGLRELDAARWLGKPRSAVDTSTVVTQGDLTPQRGTGTDRTVSYVGDLAELWLTLGPSGTITAASLLLPNPTLAARASGAAFAVTVLSSQGRHLPADYATAISVTFLREALGCPLTRATALYAELLATKRPIPWSNATISFDTIAGRPGLTVKQGP